MKSIKKQEKAKRIKALEERNLTKEEIKKNIEDFKMCLLKNINKLNISSFHIENEIIDVSNKKDVFKTYKKEKTYINIEIEN